MGGFLPGKKYGGPPVSVDNFCSMMKDESECYIVTLNHDMGDSKSYEGIHEGWNDRGNAQVMYLSDKNYNITSFKKVIIDLKPDYIYLQSLFQRCVFPCLRLAKQYKVKVVLAPRGELCSGAFIKKYKKTPYIVLLKVMRLLKGVEFQSTSDEETRAIGKYLGAKQKNIHLLTNIPSIPYDLPKKSEKQKGKGKFVFISRILWKKNLLSAIKFFNGVNGNVQFDIYGPQEDKNYWEECEKAILELPSNIHVEYKGVLSHEEIHITFNKYDAFIFPTLSENFGHVIAESLVSECIPIISDQTPWCDINEANAGWSIPLESVDEYRNAIQVIVDMNEEQIGSMREAIKDYLQKKLQLNVLKNQYLEVFQ